MHDQIERTTHELTTYAERDTDAECTTDAGSAIRIDLRAAPETIDPRDRPDGIDVRPSTTLSEPSSVPGRASVLLAGGAQGPAHPGLGGLTVWVAATLAVLASAVVILVVSQHPQPVATPPAAPAAVVQAVTPG